MKRTTGVSDGAEPGAALERLAESRGVAILDRIGSEAALIEIDEDQIERIEHRLPGWTVTPERGIARPAPPFPRGKWKLSED